MTTKNVVWKGHGWARTVRGLTCAQGAKCFVGKYFRYGVQRKLRIGKLVLEVTPGGGRELARFFRVTPEGLKPVHRGPWDWRDEFATVIQVAAKLLGEPVPNRCKAPGNAHRTLDQNDFDRFEEEAFEDAPLRPTPADYGHVDREDNAAYWDDQDLMQSNSMFWRDD